MVVLLQIALVVGMIAAAQAGLPHAPPLVPVAPPLGPIGLPSNPSRPPGVLGPGPTGPIQPPAVVDYGYRYSVNDYKGNEHSHQQQRVGSAVTGQYKVLLPDGRLQIVTYIADENGYRAKVEYAPSRPGEATTAGHPGGGGGGPVPAGSSPTLGINKPPSYPNYPTYTLLSGSRPVFNRDYPMIGVPITPEQQNKQQDHELMP